MIASAIRVHGTNRSELHVYGARLFDEVFEKNIKHPYKEIFQTHFSVADFAVYDFLPSFIACYALFAWSASKVASCIFHRIFEVCFFRSARNCALLVANSARKRRKCNVGSIRRNLPRLFII